MKRALFSLVVPVAAFSLAIVAFSYVSVQAQVIAPISTPVSVGGGGGGASSCYVWSTNLTIGSRGPDVVALQTWLLGNGFDIPALSSGRQQRGVYSYQTAGAVAKYQASVGIPATGYFGALTRAALNGSCTTTNPTQSSVTVVNPKGGETITQGQNFTIQWSTQNIPSNSETYIYLVNSANGVIVDEIASGLNASSGQFSWNTTLPEIVQGYPISPGQYEVDIEAHVIVPVNTNNEKGFIVIKGLSNNFTLASSTVSNNGVQVSNTSASLGSPTVGTNGIISSYPVTFAFTLTAGNSPIYLTSAIMLDFASKNGNASPDKGAIMANPASLAGDTSSYWMIPPGASRQFTFNGTVSSASATVGGANIVQVADINYSTNPNNVNGYSITSGLQSLQVTVTFGGVQTQSSATITSSVQTTSLTPTISGTANGTTQVGIVLSGSNGGDKIYGSGLISVINGNWSVTVSPALAIGQYTVYVYDSNNNKLTTGSLVVNPLGTTQPSITVTYPNGGEQISLGVKNVDFRTTWISSGLTGNVYVYLNFADGGTCLLGSAPVSQGYFTATLGKNYQCTNIPRTIIAGQYKVLLASDYGNPAVIGIHDSSDNYFTITLAQTTAPQPPVISGGTFPTSLNVGQMGTWTVNASDPQNGSLTYSVNWGDTIVEALTPSAMKSSSVQTSTFSHVYKMAGTYNVVFTVQNAAGLTAHTSASVQVGSTNTTPSCPAGYTCSYQTGFPAPAPSTTQSQGSLYAYVASASSDMAGTYGILGPGTSNGTGFTSNDWDWTAVMTLPTAKTAQWIYLSDGNNWERWFTGSAFGLYPLVIYENGVQLNHSYDVPLSFTAGTHTLSMYGQPERSQFPGGTLYVQFTDGTSLTAQIPASSITPAPVTVTTTQSSIKITSPSSSVTWQQSTLGSWTWTSSGNVSTVDIYLEIGSTYYPFASSYPNSGWFQWNVGSASGNWKGISNIPNGTYTIAVCPAGAYISTTSCGEFNVTITGNAPSVGIVSPTGGQTFQVGSQLSVTFSNPSQGDQYLINLDYAGGEGSPIYALGNVTGISGNQQTVSFIIPSSVPAGSYFVQVVQRTNQGAPCTNYSCAQAMSNSFTVTSGNTNNPATATLSLDASSPLAGMVQISTTAQTNNVPLAVFDINVQNAPATLNSLNVNINTTGASVSSLFSDIQVKAGGLTYSASSINGSSVSFTNISIPLPASSNIPVTISGTVAADSSGALNGSSATVSLAANNSNVVIVDQSYNTVQVTNANLSGSPITFVSSVVQVSNTSAVLGSPITSNVGGVAITTGYNVSYSFTLTAANSTIYISSNPSTSLGITNTGPATLNLPIAGVITNPGNLSGDTNPTASNGSYVIPAGSSRQFTYNGTIMSSGTAGFSSFQVNQINYGTSPSSLQASSITQGLSGLRVSATALLPQTNYTASIWDAVNAAVNQWYATH